MSVQVRKEQIAYAMGCGVSRRRTCTEVVVLNFLFCCVLVLSVTGLFAFIAPQVGLTIGVVTSFLLIVNTAFLILNRKVLLEVLRRSALVRYWLVVLLLWPLVTTLYAPAIELREIGLRFYYVTLFLGAVVFVATENIAKIRVIMSASLILSFLGVLLQYVVPEYFEPVATLSGSEISREGRVSGFLMQPNQLAISLVYMYIVWFAFSRRRIGYVFNAIAMLCLVSAVLLTGSRLGAISALGLVVLIVMADWYLERKRYKALLRTAALLGAIIFAAVTVTAGIALLDRGGEDWTDLNDRVRTVLAFRLTTEGSLQSDESLTARRAGQAVYFDLIEESPLIGHGFGADVYYQKTGLIFLSAHSTGLAFAMECGVIYPVIFLSLIMSLGFVRTRKNIEALIGTNSIFQFLALTAFLFPIASINDTRVFYVALGIFVSIISARRSINVVGGSNDYYLRRT